MFATSSGWQDVSFFSFTHAHTEDDANRHTMIVHRAPVVIFFNWFNDVVSPSKAGGNLSSRKCRILNNISTVYDILWILADAY